VDGIRSTHGEMKNAHKILVGKSESKISHRRSRRIYENNIIFDLKE